MTGPGVVLDASTLVVYALNDLRALPIDELLGEVADTGSPVIISWFALDEARQVLIDDPAALDRLETFSMAYGFRFADAQMTKTVDLVAAEAGVTRGLAHAMILTGAGNGRRRLATYAAATLGQAGFDMTLVYDLDEMFRPE